MTAHVGYRVDKVTVNHIFLRVRRFFLASNVTPVYRFYLYMSYTA
jgi:hypothetical protein